MIPQGAVLIVDISTHSRAKAAGLNGRLAAAQPYTKNGWFEHKYGDSDGKAFMQVLVTPLGMMKLAQKLEIAV